MANSNVNEAPPPPNLMAGIAGKYLTFRLAGEEYGIGILQVCEIIGLLPITMVPRMPDFVRGVINLRGKVIPVIDLRLKFGLQSVEDTKQTCVIVVEVKCADGTTLMGLLVDTVSEVLNIVEAEVDRAVVSGRNQEANFMLGAAKIKGKVKILLDIQRILSAEEFTTFSSLA